MSFYETAHGIGEVVATAIGANEFNIGLTNTKPSILPVVYVVARTTTPTYKNYSGNPDSNGKLVAYGRQSKHIGTCYVLVSSAASLAVDHQNSVKAIDLIVEALMSDLTLRGIGNKDRVARINILNIDTYAEEWEQVTYSGLKFDWDALEL